MKIGFCDDVREDIEKIKYICESYLQEQGIEYESVSFLSGEELFAHFSEGNTERIDLLFLDVEMPGMDGLEIKERLRTHDMVWRIVFVSSHQESIYQAFGTKTLGYVNKPYLECEITRWLDDVWQELEDNLQLSFDGLKQTLRLLDVCYLRGDRNYTEIYLADGRSKLIVSRQLGQIEKDLHSVSRVGKSLIRVHKSYIVNLNYVNRLEKNAITTDYKDVIPVGRAYKASVKEQYNEYVLRKARRRV